MLDRPINKYCPFAPHLDPCHYGCALWTGGCCAIYALTIAICEINEKFDMEDMPDKKPNTHTRKRRILFNLFNR